MRSKLQIGTAAAVLSFLYGILGGIWFIGNASYRPLPVAAQEQGKHVQTANAPWLSGTTEEKFAQIEKHLRGLDVAMAEIGYRYGELHVAARERNWEYAKYQTEKIDLALRLALERRPKRAASSLPSLSEALPAVMRAIESKNVPKMAQAMNQLHDSCIECHKSENVLHFRSAVERIRNYARR